MRTVPLERRVRDKGKNMKKTRKWTRNKYFADGMVSEISGPFGEDDIFQVWVTKFDDIGDDGFPRAVVLELWQVENEYSKPKKRPKKLQTQRCIISNT